VVRCALNFGGEPPHRRSGFLDLFSIKFLSRCLHTLPNKGIN
jgi:hypothetical protein